MCYMIRKSAGSHLSLPSIFYFLYIFCPIISIAALVSIFPASQRCFLLDTPLPAPSPV